MTSYQKLILETQIALEELDMECQEKINEEAGTWVFRVLLL